MGLLWRMLGVRVGRQLFDDGASIVEKTMTTLGDQVTLGERAFVHYGVQVGAQARIAPESFVMKGEQLEAGSRWQGNPAQATGGAC
jgi:carbonic anhydrase/acetyltransferase-like protein (isoleucine patch superfamily)